MRRLLIIAVIATVVMIAGTANATLLGIKPGAAGAVPDIWYDAGGTVAYDESADLFELIAWDTRLYLSKPGVGINLFPYVGFGLAIQVDENGDFIGGVSNHTFTWDPDPSVPGDEYSYTSPEFDMVEYVNQDFSFDWKGVTYDFLVGDRILEAEVIAFGWDETNKNQFDFRFGPVSGKLVDYGLWPSPDPATVAYIDTGVVPGVDIWENDWSVATEKGDKYVTPEPGTILLLGLGLVGLAGYGWRRKRKQS